MKELWVYMTPEPKVGVMMWIDADGAPHACIETDRAGVGRMVRTVGEQANRLGAKLYRFTASEEVDPRTMLD